MKLLCIYAILFLFSCSSVNNIDDYQQELSDSFESILEYEIYALCNETRYKDLVWDSKASYVARDWSTKMNETKAVTHIGFPGRRENVFEMMFPNSGKIYAIGENVARYPYSLADDPVILAKRIFAAWMKSPEHRRNILNESFHYTGVGVSLDDRNIYATQIWIVYRNNSFNGVID